MNDDINLSNIPGGDMPGDKIMITAAHVEKASKIFPYLKNLLMPMLDGNPCRRAVVSVCGGSGVGKSEIASLLAHYFRQSGIGCYVLSGDNYPHRIPAQNDAERLRIFRSSGIRGLIINGQYTKERQKLLRGLQLDDKDAAPGLTADYPWLGIYQEAGRNGLKNYLGKPQEINFEQLQEVLSLFKNGAQYIHLRRMGRGEADLWYDSIDFSDIRILFLEWTHANSDYLEGVDIPILLSSTPEETLKHRKLRNRDAGADSSFTAMVLDIEQGLLVSQTSKAKIVVSKDGEVS